MSETKFLCPFLTGRKIGLFDHCALRVGNLNSKLNFHDIQKQLVHMEQNNAQNKIAKKSQKALRKLKI